MKHDISKIWFFRPAGGDAEGQLLDPGQWSPVRLRSHRPGGERVERPSAATVRVSLRLDLKTMGENVTAVNTVGKGEHSKGPAKVPSFPVDRKSVV